MTKTQTKKGCDFFRLPYRSWPQKKILDHFQNRTEIHYFSVIDADETTPEKIDNILLNRFEFNHESYSLPEAFEWTDNPSKDIEWSILLHKFYYAVGLGAAFHKTKDQRYVKKWIALTSSWIDTVPLNFLSSDVAGRRIQNWIYAHYYFVTLNHSQSIGTTFYMKFLQSIHDQVIHLAEHLTEGRNHRTLELYAIFLAAVVFPELKGADMWLAFAKEELSKNIRKDILPDGVHCELSTDYHHIVLKNYLNIRKLAVMNKIAMPEQIDTQIKKALEFSLYVHKPDGLIPSLSDGDSRNFLDLLEGGAKLYDSEEMLYAATLGTSGQSPPERSKGFPNGGYYILRSGWGEGTTAYEDERYLVFDCGPLGEGNHGHLDVLSFEMAAYGRSLIVDPGRYTYDESGKTNWRVRFRETAYHNTVMIDKKNQTAYLPGKNKFKIKGPGPDYELKSFVTRPGFDYLHGIAKSHEYEVIHERKIFFVGGEYWLVSDLLRAGQKHDYDLLFHLSDEAFEKTSVLIEEETVHVHAPHLVIAQVDCPDIQLHVDEGYVSPCYGKKHPAPILRFAAHGKNRSYHTIMYPYQMQLPKIAMKYLSVSGVSGKPVSNLTSALCVTFIQEGKIIEDLFFSAEADSKEEYIFGRFQYNGQYLFVRSDAKGNICSLEGEAGAVLIASGEPITLQESSA